MQIGVIGINHNNASLQLREILAKVCQDRFGDDATFFGDRSFILLNTCNRTEIYFTTTDFSQTHTHLLHLMRSDTNIALDQKLYTFFGRDCFHHLCRVTSGLDSAIVGESDIQRQVKEAYISASHSRSLSSTLHYAFQKALKISKDLRTRFPLCRGVPALEHALLHVGQHVYDNFLERPILFVGASQANRKLLHFFKNKGAKNLTLTNRTDATAESLCSQENISHLPWSSSWSPFATIILATKSPAPLITAPPSRPTLLFDLCVPRNAHPALSRHPLVKLLNIDQLNRFLKIRRKKLTHLLDQAEGWMESKTKRYMKIYAKKLALCDNQLTRDLAQ